jgi:hypothetical protein
LLPVAAFNVNGTPYLGNIDKLTACTGSDGVDVEELPFCDNGVQKIRIQVFTNGVLTSTFWTDVLNNPVLPPVDPLLVTEGACVVDSPVVVERPICDNGVQKIVRLCYAGCALSSVQYFDLANNPVPAPVDFGLVTLGRCETPELDVVYSDTGVVCFDDNGVLTQYFTRQQSIVNNQTASQTVITEYSLDGSTWTTIPPVGIPTPGECFRKELDVVYSDTVDVCVTDPTGIRTSYLIRQKSTVDNTDGSQITVTEYSLDGVTWTTTAPVGSITLGKCSDRCVPLSKLPTLTATPSNFNPNNLTLPYATITQDGSGFNRLVRDGCWSVPINTTLTGPVGTADMQYVSGQLNLAAAPNTCVDINNSTVDISVDVTLDALVNLNPAPADNDVYLWFGPTGGTLASGIFSTVDVSTIGVGNTVTLSITIPANTINIPVNRLVLWMEPRDAVVTPLPQYIGITFNNLKFTPNYDTDDCEVDAERVTVCNAVELVRGTDCADAIVVRTCNETLLWKECLEYTSIGELAPSDNYNILQFNSNNQITVLNVVNGVYSSTLPPITLSYTLPVATPLGVPSFDGKEFIFVAAGQVYRYKYAASGGTATLISVSPITGIADTFGPPVPTIDVITVHPATGDILALSWNTANDLARLYKLNPVTGVLSYITDIAAFPAGPVLQLDFVVTPDNRVFIITQGQSVLTEVGFPNGETVKTYNLPGPALTLSHGRGGTLLIGFATVTQEYNVLTGSVTTVLPFSAPGIGEQELKGGWKAQSLGRENVIRFTRAYLKDVSCDSVRIQDHALDTGLPINIPSTAVLKPCNLDTREISWTQCLEYLYPVPSSLGVLALRGSDGSMVNSGGTCTALAGFIVPPSTNNISVTHNSSGTELYHLDGFTLKRFDWNVKTNPVLLTTATITGVNPGTTAVDLRNNWLTDTLWLMVTTSVPNQVEFYTVDVGTAVATYKGAITLPGDNPRFTWTITNYLLVSYQVTPGNYVVSAIDTSNFTLGPTFITNASIPPALNAIKAINTDVTGNGSVIITTEGPPGPNLVTFVGNTGTIISQCGTHTGNRDTITVPSGPLGIRPIKFTRVYIKDLVTDLVRVQDHDAVTGLEIVLPIDARIGTCDTLIGIGDAQIKTGVSHRIANDSNQSQNERISTPDVVDLTERVTAGNNTSVPAGFKSVMIRKDTAEGVVNINLPGGPFRLTENQSNVTIEVRKGDYFSYVNYQLPAIDITGTDGAGWSWISVG